MSEAKVVSGNSIEKLQSDPETMDMGHAALSLVAEPDAVQAPSDDHIEPEAPDVQENAEGAQEGPNEPEKAPDAEGQEGTETQEGEEEGEFITTVDELLEAKEVDPDTFSDLKVKVRINDENSEVSVKDLIAGYQMNGAAQKYLEDAKADRAKAKEERTQIGQTANLQLGVAAKLMAWVGQEIEGQDNLDELESLRESDPGEYAARVAEINQRKQRFEEAKGEAFNALQQEAQQHAETSVQDFNQQNVERFTKLREAIPEWGPSEDDAKAEYLKLGEYLVAQGFPAEDVLVASDHRHFLIARKAFLYDQLQDNNNAASKKVVKAPKVLKPGTKTETKTSAPKSDAELFYGS